MKLLIAALLTAFSTGAMAEWTYLTSKEDMTHDIYIDKTTIRQKGNVARMWDLTDFKAPQKVAGGEPFLSLRRLTEYDCVEIRTNSLALTYFSGNMGKGEVVFSHQYKDEKWRDVAPETVGMLQWQAACKK